MQTETRLVATTSECRLKRLQSQRSEAAAESRDLTGTPNIWELP